MTKVLTTLCFFGLMSLTGCNEKPLSELKAEVAAREEAAKQTAEREAAKKRDTYSFVGPKGYTYFLMKVCVDGVEYYYGNVGQSGIFAPVVTRTNLHPVPCDES